MLYQKVAVLDMCQFELDEFTRLPKDGFYLMKKTCDGYLEMLLETVLVQPRDPTSDSGS